MGLQKADQIMRELGFRKDSSEAVQVAFIKSLIRKNFNVEATSPLRLQRAAEVSAAPVLEEQLSFDLDSSLKVS